MAIYLYASEVKITRSKDEDGYLGVVREIDGRPWNHIHISKVKADGGEEEIKEACKDIEYAEMARR